MEKPETLDAKDHRSSFPRALAVAIRERVRGLASGAHSPASEAYQGFLGDFCLRI